MQKNLYEVAILQDTPTAGSASGEVDTKIVVQPTQVLATNAQSARDKAVRLLDADTDTDRCRIFVREIASTYNY